MRGSNVLRHRLIEPLSGMKLGSNKRLPLTLGRPKWPASALSPEEAGEREKAPPMFRRIRPAPQSGVGCGKQKNEAGVTRLVWYPSSLATRSHQLMFQRRPARI